MKTQTTLLEVALELEPISKSATAAIHGALVSQASLRNELLRRLVYAKLQGQAELVAELRVAWYRAVELVDVLDQALVMARGQPLERRSLERLALDEELQAVRHG